MSSVYIDGRIRPTSRADLFLTYLREEDFATTVFIKTCEEWLDVRNGTLKILYKLADDLDGHHKNVNIASIAGTSISALGSTAAIGGLLLAPVTGGWSAILTFGGAAAGLGGGMTAIGASITELGVTHFKCKENQVTLDRDREMSVKLMEKMENYVESSLRMDDFLSTIQFTDMELIEIANRCNYLVNLEELGRSAYNRLRDFVEQAREFAKDKKVKEALNLLNKAMKAFGCPDIKTHLFDVLKNFSNLIKLEKKEFLSALKAFLKNPAATLPKAARVGLSALSAVFIIIDVYVIIQTAIDVHKGSKSKVGKEIRQMNRKLRQGRNDVIAVINAWVQW